MPHKTPSSAAQFTLSIDGTKIAGFSELQGITTEVGPVHAKRKLLGHELTHVLQNAAGVGPVTLIVKTAELGQVAARRLRGATGRMLTLSVPAGRGGRDMRYRGKLAAPTRSKTADTVTIVCEQLQRVSV